MVEHAVAEIRGPKRSLDSPRHHPAKVEAYAKRHRCSLAEAERRLDAASRRESR
jgi:hypothetical protein